MEGEFRGVPVNVVVHFYSFKGFLELHSIISLFLQKLLDKEKLLKRDLYIHPKGSGNGITLQFTEFRFERAANNIKAKPLNSQQRVLSVAPLNSRPYIGPPSPGSYTAKAPPTTMDKEAVDKYSPAIVLLPSSSEQEIQNVLAVTKNGVVLTGAAAKGQVGPAVGAMDIAETEDSYFFRVNLPGVAEQGFSCNIEPDGKVLIKGVTTTGEKTVCKNSQVFHMLSQNLCPPGHFSVSFVLPGLIDRQQFNGYLKNGIYEGRVKKRL